MVLIKTKPETIGIQPSLSGQICEAFICEGYEYKGVPVSQANVVYIRAANVWHRLVIDASVVFWRIEKIEPQPFAVPEAGFNYPHRNIGQEFGLEEEIIEGVESSAEGNLVEVAIRFTSGQQFKLQNCDDKTSFRIDSSF